MGKPGSGQEYRPWDRSLYRPQGLWSAQAAQMVGRVWKVRRAGSQVPSPEDPLCLPKTQDHPYPCSCHLLESWVPLNFPTAWRGSIFPLALCKYLGQLLAMNGTFILRTPKSFGEIRSLQGGRWITRRKKKKTSHLWWRLGWFKGSSQGPASHLHCLVILSPRGRAKHTETRCKPFSPNAALCQQLRFLVTEVQHVCDHTQAWVSPINSWTVLQEAAGRIWVHGTVQL